MNEQLPWLTDGEVRDLTGYARPALQARWLASNGRPYLVNGKGKIRVPRSGANEPEAAEGIPVYPSPPKLSEILGIQQLLDLPSLGGKGIYFLWKGDELLYIGKSECIASRIESHRYARDNGARSLSYSKQIPFDRFTALVLSESPLPSEDISACLREHERAYIAHYRPPFNHDGENPGT